MSWYTWAWIGWFLYFVVVEGIALANKRNGDTLSEHVWKWFTSKGSTNPFKWPFRRYLLAAGMIWLTGHFLFGWWAG